MKRFSSKPRVGRNPDYLNPNSLVFQVGRLFFPELINRGRAMRFRMRLIFGIFGLALMVGTAAMIFKQSGAVPIQAREAQPLKPLK